VAPGFVYAPEDAGLNQARRVFRQHGPACAQRCLPIAIERIVENAHAP